jgi:predicted ABC-type transport system involved in lysophospholipase L1 biosynthesis ATPase subunit
VIVTHDAAIGARAPRRLLLRDGQIERDERGDA